MSGHRAECYIQLEPEFGWNNESIRSIRAIRMTQKKPSAQVGGTVLVKLTLEVPDAAFRPLTPEAVIVVPDSLTHAEPILVQATDPNEYD